MAERNDHHDHEDGRAADQARSDPSAASQQSEPDGRDHVLAQLALLREDDLLLDALGGADPGATGSLADQQLNELLLSWRRDVDSEPIPELVDVEMAAGAIAAGHRPVRRMHRLLVPLASAAAVLAIAFTGVGLAARDAQPGDPLWGVTRVLYSDHARSVEAAASVRVELDTARLALHDGRIADARSALAKAEVSLPSVSREDGKADLQAKHESLLQELSTTPPVTGTSAPSSPSAPPSSQPAPTSASPTVTSTPSASRLSATSVPSSPSATSPLLPPPATSSTTPGTAAGTTGTESNSPAVSNSTPQAGSPAS